VSYLIVFSVVDQVYAYIILCICTYKVSMYTVSYCAPEVQCCSGIYTEQVPALQYRACARNPGVRGLCFFEQRTARPWRRLTRMETAHTNGCLSTCLRSAAVVPQTIEARHTAEARFGSDGLRQGAWAPTRRGLRVVHNTVGMCLITGVRGFA